MEETDIPLSTTVSISKKKLIDCLRRSDIPEDDSELTLLFDEESGVLSLHFYWSNDTCAYGQDAVCFDIEKDYVLRDIKKFFESGFQSTERKTHGVKKSLSTNFPISKNDFLKHLETEDIPDDARLTLKIDHKSGTPYLFFYWSEGPGAFGHTAVDFDIERNDILEDAKHFLNNQHNQESPCSAESLAESTGADGL